MEFFQDIVMQSGAKLAGQAEMKANNTSAVHTPFAAAKLNAEMAWSQK